MPLIRDEFEHQRWLLPHIKHRQSIGNLSEDTSLHNPNIRLSKMSYNLERGSVSDEDLDNEIEEGVNASYASSSDTSCTNEADKISPVETGEEGSRLNASNKSTNKRKSSSISEDVKQHSRKKKKPSISDVDEQFYTTMKSLINALNRPQEQNFDAMNFDEDKLFCLSLAAQLKDLEPRMKSMVKLQIMKIFHEVQLSKIPSQPPFVNQNTFQPSNPYFFTRQVMGLNSQQRSPIIEDSNHFDNGMSNIENF